MHLGFAVALVPLPLLTSCIAQGVPMGRVRIQGLRFLLDSVDETLSGRGPLFTLDDGAPFNATRFRLSPELELLKLGDHYIFKFPQTDDDVGALYLGLGSSCLTESDHLGAETAPKNRATAFQIFPAVDGQRGFIVHEPDTGANLYRRRIHERDSIFSATPHVGLASVTTTRLYQPYDPSFTWSLVPADPLVEHKNANPSVEQEKEPNIDTDLPLFKHSKCNAAEPEVVVS